MNMDYRELILQMQQLREKMIRERAYYLWLNAGAPHDQHNKFWLLAEQLHLKTFWREAVVETHKLYKEFSAGA